MKILWALMCYAALISAAQAGSEEYCVLFTEIAVKHRDYAVTVPRGNKAAYDLYFRGYLQGYLENQARADWQGKSADELLEFIDMHFSAKDIAWVTRTMGTIEFMRSLNSACIEEYNKASEAVKKVEEDREANWQRS